MSLRAHTKGQHRNCWQPTGTHSPLVLRLWHYMSKLSLRSKQALSQIPHLCMHEFRLVTSKMGDEWLPGKLVMASSFTTFYCLGLGWNGELPFCIRRTKTNLEGLGMESWKMEFLVLSWNLFLDSLPPNSFMEKNNFSWMLAIILRVWSKPRWSLCNELDLIVTKI